MTAFKNKERGTWTAKFYFTDWTGKRKQKKKEGFATKKEALEFENDFLNSCENTSNITFKHLVKEYIQDCESRLKPTSMRTKRTVIYKKILPYFENMNISDITVYHIRKWQNELITSEEHFSETYLKALHCQLSAIFNFATKFYGLKSNPASICGTMGKRNADSMQFWTKQEFDTFIRAVEDKPVSKTIFNLLFYSGMRKGEMLALTLNDFNFNSNTVSITKNYARIDSKDIIQTPKTDKSIRTVTLPKQILEMVKEYSQTLYGYEPNQRLFPIGVNYLYKEMKRGCDISNVKRIRIHDLRHSHASLLIEMGVSPLLISERLGHQDIQTTLSIYSHLYPNKHEEVAEKLEKMIQI